MSKPIEALSPTDAAALEDALAGVLDDRYATAEQGAKADTAVQPGSLGTAAAQNVEAFATAATLSAALREWSVAFYAQGPRVDPYSGKVRYPRMILMRNGETYKEIDPATHAGAVSGWFELPMSTVSTVQYHYIDVTKIGGGTTPLLSISGGGAPDTADSNLVPLGRSWIGTYASDAGAQAIRLDDSGGQIALSSGLLPPIDDRWNVKGGGAGVYMPIANIFARAPHIAVSGAGRSGAGNADLGGNMAGYCFLALTGLPGNTIPGTVNYVVYDLDADMWRVVAYSSVPGNLAGVGYRFVIAGVLDGNWGLASPSGLRWVQMGKPPIEGARLPRYPIIVEGTSVTIPETYAYDSEGRARTRLIPADASLYFPAQSIPTGNASERAHYFDLDVVDGGGSHNDALKTVDGNGAWRVGGRNRVLVGRSLSGIFHPANGNMIVGDQGMGQQPNMFRYAVGDDMLDSRVFLRNNTAITAITSTTLNAWGITKAAYDPVYNEPFVGAYFDTSPKVGQRIFMRFFVQTDIANDFGTSVNAYLRTASTFAGLTARLIRKISDYEREYCVWDTVAAAGWTYFIVGAFGTSTTAVLKVAGEQYHCSDAPAWWIRRGDYPRAVTETPTEEAFAARDAANIAEAQAILNRSVTHVQRPTADYNLLTVVGQSLAEGQQTQFALSETAMLGNKMLGGSIWPALSDSTNYPVYGGAVAWQDMVAAPQLNGTIYTNETSPDDARGEPWNAAWLNTGKHHLNQMMMTANDPRTFCTINASIGGKTLAQLSKGTGRFGRLTDGLDKAAAASAGSTLVCAGIAFGQGEYDYSTIQGSTDRTRALYKARLLTYFDDLQDEAAARMPDQALPVPIFSYITSAGYTVDTDANGDPDLFVAMAQQEVADERTDTWIFGMASPYPDKGGHPTANGARWLGAKLVQVWSHIVLEGRDWTYLRPKRIEGIGNAIYVDFLVPAPPLQWLATYVGRTATMYPNKGFRVIDVGASNATVDITVELVGQTIVRLNLIGSYTSHANLRVYYSDKTVHNGNGNLADSDPTLARDVYIYDPDYMPVEDNIPELVGKRYALNNWGAPFFLPVGYVL